MSWASKFGLSPLTKATPALALECDDVVTENNEQHFRPAGHRVSL